MLLVPPMNVTLTERENATFTCRVTGRPRPSIMWIYLESLPAMPPMMMPAPLIETSGKYIISERNVGERELRSNLIVVGTLSSDTGFYVCFAENEVAGGIVMESAFLSVQGQ